MYKNRKSRLFSVWIILGWIFCSRKLYSSTAESLFSPANPKLLGDLLLMNNNRFPAKFFHPDIPRASLFHVVKFPNDECVDASNQIGTCYTQLQCKAYGGSGTVSCAKGYGTCCIISRSCHNSTSQKVVYFTNPSYPSTDKQNNFCDLTVDVRDPEVCQLRIDFLDFQLDQPTNGNCLGDKLRISATGLPINHVPLLCGSNRNQHLYVHLRTEIRDRNVGIFFETNSDGAYRWHLRITQVDCSRGIYANRLNRSFLPKPLNNQVYARPVRSIQFLDNLLDKYRTIRQKRSFLLTTEASLRVTPSAPTGCLQYYTQNTGVIESFNFGHYFNNLDYAICIEHEPSSCKIAFSAAEGDFGIEPTAKFRTGRQNTDLAASGDIICADDYFMIPSGSANGNFPTKDRYCGSRLQPGELLNGVASGLLIPQFVVSKANGPIVLRFHTDFQFGSSLRTGFKIRYQQLASDCDGAILRKNINRRNNSQSLNISTLSIGTG